MESGLKYIISKEGIIKLLVIVLACTTFALIADTKFYLSSIMGFVFAAFIVAFAISLIFYVFRVTELSKRMGTCGPCTFDGFDFTWSWFCTIFCLSAAVAFSIQLSYKGGRSSPELIAAVVLAYVTGIMYAVESYVLRSRAPAQLGYISTRNGWLKSAIVAVGAMAFGLLVDSGYPWPCSSSCKSGITFVLVAYVIAWVLMTLMWILHIAGVFKTEHRRQFQTAEFSFSVISILLFATGTIIFAIFLNQPCRSFNSDFCQKRLTSIIAGGVAAVLCIVDAVFTRPVNL